MLKSISEDEVKNWMRQINLSLSWRKQYEENWDRIIDYLKTKYFKDMSDEDRICVNMVHPHVRVVIPAIYSRNPDIIVTPRKQQMSGADDLVRKRAEVIQTVLRYYLKELDLKMEVKLCILDAILTGHAWIKTGYETDIEKVTTKTEKKKTSISQFLQVMGVKEQDSEDEYENEENYVNEKIVGERPWALRISPYDMIIPALSRRMEELPFIGESIICPYDEVMENDDYDTKGLKPSATANQLLAKLRGSKHRDLGHGDEIKYLIKYEIWVRKTKQIITLAPDHPRPLEVKDSEYTFLDSKHHPYVQLRFNEVPDEFYPVSDIEPAEPQMEELNDIRTQMRKHRKRYNRRYISRPGAFDPQSKADLQEGEDGIVVEHSNQYMETDLQNVIWPIADAQMPAEVYAVETRMRDDIFTILGTSDYASQAAGGARTATEASIIATQSRFRVEERIDLVGQFVSRIVRNLAMISQRFMTPEQIEDIVGKDSLYWMQLKRRAEIRGEFLYDIIYASTAPINRELETEQFMKFYVMAKDDPMYNQVKLRVELARRFPNIGNAEDWLDPEITKIIEQQRLMFAKAGLLTPGVQEGAQNASGSAGRVPRPNTRGGQGSLPTGQPRGLPGDRGSRPETPGGRGGTDLG